MSNRPQRRYKKEIELHYVYVKSPEGEAALAGVFDDIFRRIIKKRKEKQLLKNEAKH
jgi:hypothetical protein